MKEKVPMDRCFWKELTTGVTICSFGTNQYNNGNCGTYGLYFDFFWNKIKINKVFLGFTQKYCDNAR
jgi:hypothetical protein